MQLRQAGFQIGEIDIKLWCVDLVNVLYRQITANVAQHQLRLEKSIFRLTRLRDRQVNRIALDILDRTLPGAGQRPGGGCHSCQQQRHDKKGNTAPQRRFECQFPCELLFNFHPRSFVTSTVDTLSIEVR